MSGQRLQVPGRMVRAGAEWSHAGAEGARAGAEHVSLLETGIRNSYAPEVHYTLTSHREARGCLGLDLSITCTEALSCAQSRKVCCGASPALKITLGSKYV